MCSVPACYRSPSRTSNGHSWGTLCTAHRRADRRHGDPLQRPILKAHLTPYLKSLSRRRRNTKTAPIWNMLPARWELLLARAKGIMDDREAGVAGNRWENLAAEEIRRVALQAKPEDAWQVACATFMLQEYDPRRFVSDRSFRFQLGRQVRHLAEANRGSFYDHTTGRVKFAYRDPNPRVAEKIGEWLAEAFGVAGMRFAALDRIDMENKAQERETFYGALEGAAFGETLGCT